MKKADPVTRFLAALILAGTCVAAGERAGSKSEETCETYVPIRAITRGPESHWFGYYDKPQFDPTGRYVLGAEVDFDDRSPSPDDVIRLGMVDLERDDTWIEFAETRAWSWQQGCMLQWLPGSDSKVIYNDRRGDSLVSVILDVFTGESRTLPKPIYAVSPKGDVAVGLNFARVDSTRPGYGYKGAIDPGADKLHPADDGIYAIDLHTGESRLVVSLDQIASVPGEGPMRGKHWFNHLLFNPDGTRFVFLHRWYRQAPMKGRWRTRMFTAQPNGEGLHCVADHGMVSHFIWRSPQQILAWSNEPETGARFHLYRDTTDHVEVIGEAILKRDGHCSYSPDGKWVLTDTYPDGDRMQTLMLFRPADSKLVVLGKFYLSPEHKGEYRCDLHPRWSRDGKYVCIDSMHIGDKRQMYILDVSGIVDSVE